MGSFPMKVSFVWPFPRPSKMVTSYAPSMASCSIPSCAGSILFPFEVVALLLGTIAMTQSERARGQNPKPDTIAQITRAPYRDGIYEGKLAAQHGKQVGVPTGRWARQEDRSAFAAGFQEGCGTCHRAVAR